MKDKHAEMIKAKADNKDLVLLVKHEVSGVWSKSNFKFPENENHEYYLCHEKHKDTLSHLLNGGVVECHNDDFDDIFFTSSDIEPWKEHHWYMDENITSRIKPKKESRWIVVYGSEAQFCSDTFKSYSRAEDYAPKSSKSQIIEIKVEV